MRATKRFLVGMLASLSVIGMGALVLAQVRQAGSLIEPTAGAWKTWLLRSGDQFRLPAPPDATVSRAEVTELQTLAASRDAATLASIDFWSTGALNHRWNELALEEAFTNGLDSIRGGRVLALVNVAMYDALIAAWDSKYAYNRPRPSAFDPALPAAADVPRSPSYPSEHAVVAGAASALLTYMFPDDAQRFADMAAQAGRSSLLAGLNYPSDVTAGLALGGQVAVLAIARAKGDGSDAKWEGKMPVGPGYWNGTNPIEPLLGTWKPWVLKAGDQFRPGPPPAFDSEQKRADLAELKTFQRTPKTNDIANFWQFAVAGTRSHQFWNMQVAREVSQHHWDDNPPKAARAYALQSITFYDSLVACWDAKYAYWAIRPFQLDAEVKPLFATPNHPSYPAAHGCLSGANAAILGYLFPSEAKTYTAMAEQAAASRVWAGIHYRSDLAPGLELGRQVAGAVIEWAKTDGAH
jgi:membrane-associated phospholipid phosphatase